MDDKAKLNVGPNPCVSRLVSAGKTFLEGQAPVVPDHDIKTGSTIRGYMTINFRNFDDTNDGTNADGRLRTPYEEIADDIENNVISVDPDDILYQYIEQSPEDADNENANTREDSPEVTLPTDDMRRQVVHAGEELLGEDSDQQLDSTMDEEVLGERGRTTEREENSNSETESEKEEGTQPKVSRYEHRSLEDLVNEEAVPKVKDTIDREHVRTNRSGDGYNFLASSQTNPSTIQSHLNDITSFLEAHPQHKKFILTIIADDGEDWSLRSEKTLHYLGKFFKDQNLVRINFVKYAPGQSRYNMIERAWANMTPHLAHLILDPNRKIWTSMDKKKTPAERMNFEVLREGFGKVCDALEHYKYGEGNKWHHIVVDPEKTTVEIEGKEICNNKYDDFEDVRDFHLKKFSNKNRVQFQSSNSEKEKELAAEYKYTLEHADVRTHSIFLARCPQYDACKSCEDFYDRVESPQEFQERLKHRDRNSQKTGSNKYNQMQTLLIDQVTDVKRKIVYLLSDPKLQVKGITV